jgi:hypothetical protein
MRNLIFYDNFTATFRNTNRNVILCIFCIRSYDFVGNCFHDVTYCLKFCLSIRTILIAVSKRHFPIYLILIQITSVYNIMAHCFVWFFVSYSDHRIYFIMYKIFLIMNEVCSYCCKVCVWAEYSVFLTGQDDTFIVLLCLHTLKYSNSISQLAKLFENIVCAACSELLKF